jgi:hypothetical protein
MANKPKKKKVSAVVHELLLHQNFGKIFHKSGSYLESNLVIITK